MDDLIKRLQEAEAGSQPDQSDAMRLRGALSAIALRAVAKKGEHGQESPETRLAAIYEIADEALFIECYCGGIGETKATIGYRPGCPEADA